jgi:hypothetical protein
LFTFSSLAAGVVHVHRLVLAQNQEVAVIRDDRARRLQVLGEVAKHVVRLDAVLPHGKGAELEERGADLVEQLRELLVLFRGVVAPGLVVGVDRLAKELCVLALEHHDDVARGSLEALEVSTQVGHEVLEPVFGRVDVDRLPFLRRVRNLASVLLVLAGEQVLPADGRHVE